MGDGEEYGSPPLQGDEDADLEGGGKEFHTARLGPTGPVFFLERKGEAKTLNPSTWRYQSSGAASFQEGSAT